MRREVRRIFHPVGQGAFYSESHCFIEENDIVYESLKIVYDCGSVTKPKEFLLQNRISSGLSNGNVDIFFLSHLHEDHCNGIKYLNPKIIVIPLIEEWDKAILWLSNQLGYTNFLINIKDYLKVYAPNARFIEVEGFRPGITDADNRQGNGIDIDDVRRDIVIKSGTIINIPYATDDDKVNWVYIPINPLLDNFIVSNFKQAVKSAKLDVDRILKGDVAYFNANQGILKAIYEKLGPLNDFSMAVYSGPLQMPQNVFVNTKRLWGKADIWYPNACVHYNMNLPGCLFLGDICLKRKNKTKNQVGRKEGYVLEQIYSFLGKDIVDGIGTIQVPHHGSEDNYKVKLKQYFDGSNWKFYNHPIVYVISAGVNNQYGHPSGKVVGDLMKTRMIMNKVCIVTEVQATRYIEKIFY